MPSDNLRLADAHANKRRALARSAALLGPQVEIHEGRQGWTTFETVARQVTPSEALGVHDAWRGPTKLVHGRDGLRQRVELSLPASQSIGGRGLLDESQARREEAIRRAAIRGVGHILSRPEEPRLKNRVSAGMVRDWVVAEGYAVAADEQGGLRLAITYNGFDGQTRIDCGESQWRLTMSLGSWPSLPPAVEAAMLSLAAEVNAQTRLARVVWLEDGTKRRCETQVDLTGVPWVGESDPFFEQAARHMLQLALAGLALAARRLGRELAALAEPGNRELAEALNEWAATHA